MGCARSGWSVLVGGDVWDGVEIRGIEGFTGLEKLSYVRYEVDGCSVGRSVGVGVE